MSSRPPRFRLVHLAAVTTTFAMSAVATLSWAWTGGLDQLGVGAPPSSSRPVLVIPSSPSSPGPSSSFFGTFPPDLDVPPFTPAAPVPSPSLGGPPPTATKAEECRTGAKLVPTCGVLWGVAPGAFTDKRGKPALAAFEKQTERHQAVYHAYHRGTKQLFPTGEEVEIAREEGRERILFLNWKPAGASWAEIAAGDKKTDKYLDKLAAHIVATFPEQFFFTVHHEPEDNVKEKPGSGYTARDYAKMYRYVVERLRAHGVRNLVTVLVHMAYVPHTTQAWFDKMYPGDDVVDWIGFDTYAYSDPGYGHGDFAELLNRRMESKPLWPGFYNWAVTKHHDKPLMVAEWGVWSSKRNPGHKAEFYREVGRQIASFPNIRALVHFETPHNQDGRDSTVDDTPESLTAYRELGRLPVFQVKVDTGLS